MINYMKNLKIPNKRAIKKQHSPSPKTPDFDRMPARPEETKQTGHITMKTRLFSKILLTLLLVRKGVRRFYRDV